ncbi:lysylphosphatidylglycerol synthase transmembrane domain-containing protein [Natrinema longum]|uniref:Flippase-like domain-containing protein n=1 Tax=Natrinema longum TaxID=370324 RepID=A0A8A2U6V6_9EURY|nr:lysylphosphatidylglycerol synthase transmembrane domain-containing protein [Natrinema longum]MBZ6494310.1 flippase-like domain-containing protein [Natrinema longum]QSW84367.1 flippase-like domain-containing protein [Natrinema longum]
MNDGGERSRSEAPADGSGSGGLAGALTRRRLTIAGTVLVVLGLLVALREIDLRTVAAEISSADPLVLVAAVTVYVASWPLRGRRYGDVLAAIGHRGGTAFATGAVFVSQTANLVIPARGGDAVRAYVMNTYRDVPYTAGFASLAVERVFDLATIAALAGLATTWLVLGGAAGPLEILAEAGGARTALVAAAAVSTATVGVGFVVVTSARADHGLGSWLRRRVDGRSRLERLLETALRFAGDVQVVARQPRALATIGMGSLLVWILDVLTAVLVLAALGSGLAVGPLLAVGTLAVSVGNLAKVLPLSQGGVGLYEAAFTALVVGLTPIGASTALAAAIVDHALKNGVTLVGGAGSVASLGISLSDAAESNPDATRGTDTFLGEPKK